MNVKWYAQATLGGSSKRASVFATKDAAEAYLRTIIDMWTLTNNTEASGVIIKYVSNATGTCGFAGVVQEVHWIPDVKGEA